MTSLQAIHNLSLYLQSGGRISPPGFKSSLKEGIKALVEKLEREKGGKKWLVQRTWLKMSLWMR